MFQYALIFPQAWYNSPQRVKTWKSHTEGKHLLNIFSFLFRTIEAVLASAIYSGKKEAKGSTVFPCLPGCQKAPLLFHSCGLLWLQRPRWCSCRGQLPAVGLLHSSVQLSSWDHAAVQRLRLRSKSHSSPLKSHFACVFMPVLQKKKKKKVNSAGYSGAK